MDSPGILTYLLVFLSIDGEEVEFSGGSEGQLLPLGGGSLRGPRMTDKTLGKSHVGDDQLQGEEMSQRVGGGLRLSRQTEDMRGVSLPSCLS